MGKIQHTWKLMGASWDLLKQDREMLMFTVFSGFCSLLVTVSFALPLFASGMLAGNTEGQAQAGAGILYAVILFLFYFCNYFVIIFFNAGIVACACKRMAGGDPTVGDGLRAAFNRLHLIAGWAFLSASVGMLLRIIEERSEGIGRLVSALLGMAWTVVSFFVVPILVIERLGPIEAVKESTRLLKTTWGEQVISQFSFGIVFGMAAAPFVLLIMLGLMSGNTIMLGLGLLAGFGGLLVVGIIQSTLQTIFQAALYLYARDGRVAAGFDEALLAGAMETR